VTKTEDDSVILAVGEIGGVPGSKKRVNPGENSVNMRFLKSAISTILEQSKSSEQSKEKKLIPNRLKDLGGTPVRRLFHP